MIKEKYQWYISIVTIILSLVIVFTTTNFYGTSNSNKDKTKTLTTVLNEQTITDINIDINDSDWQWLIDNASNEEYRNCNVTINGEIYYNVGIRPKGNSSLSSVVSDETTDRYSFKLKFDEYIDGQTYKGMQSIALNNMIEDNTYMKEYISYDLYDFMGIATPEMSYSNIKINDEEWGFYLAVEIIDERYLENNFGTTEGNLYKPETMNMGKNNNGMPNLPDMNTENKIPLNRDNNEQVDREMIPQDKNDFDTMQKQAKETIGNKMGGANFNKNSEGADFVYIDDEISSYLTVRDSAVLKNTTDEDFKQVINMYKNLNEGTNLEEVLDVEEVLKYFAVNTYLVNLDSYSGAMYHNYYLYENNGVCQILPWDLNLSFGGFSGMGTHRDNAESGTSTTINFPIDNPVSGTLENMPLIGKLLEVDEYSELYHGYLKEIADKYFNSGYYAELVENIDNIIGDYVKKDKTAFCTYEDYRASIGEMITFGEDRTKSVLAQLNGEQPSTTYGDIESTINESLLSSKIGRGKNKLEKKDVQNEEDQINKTLNEEVLDVSKKPNDLIGENKKQSWSKESISKSNNYINLAELLCLSLLAIFIVTRFKRRKI